MFLNETYKYEVYIKYVKKYVLYIMFMKDTMCIMYVTYSKPNVYSVCI